MPSDAGYQLSLSEQYQMFRMLSILFQACTLTECLEVMEQGEANPRRSQIYLDIHHHLANGHTLSAALGKSCSSFSEKLIAEIRLGEETGALAVCLDAIAEDLQAEWSLRSELRTSLIYPVAVAGISLISFGGLFAFLLPRLLAVVRSLDGDPPASLQLTLTLYDFASHPITLFVLSQLFLVVLLVGRRLRSSADYELGRDQFLLHLPVVGDLSSMLEAYSFAGGLRTLIRTGCFLLTALKLLQSTMSNSFLAQKLIAVINDIQTDGIPLSEALRERDLFDSTFHNLLSCGEESGNYDKVLEILAAHYRERVEEKIVILVALLEPAVLCILGTLVGLLVVAVFLPLTEIIGSI